MINGRVNERRSPSSGIFVTIQSMLTISNQITVIVLLKGTNFFLWGCGSFRGSLLIGSFCLFIFWYMNLKEGELLFFSFFVSNNSYLEHEVWSLKLPTPDSRMGKSKVLVRASVN